MPYAKTGQVQHATSEQVQHTFNADSESAFKTSLICRVQVMTAPSRI